MFGHGVKVQILSSFRNFYFFEQHDLKQPHFSPDRTKIKNSKHILSLCFTAELSAN